jgi:hypothetical protein
MIVGKTRGRHEIDAVMMMEVVRTNPFESGGSRSSQSRIDDKLRLALGRGLAAAYAGVVEEPIPESLQNWLRRLEERDQRERG